METPKNEKPGATASSKKKKRVRHTVGKSDLNLSRSRIIKALGLNTSANGSFLIKSTLRSNNKALAHALQSSRQENRQLHQALIDERVEKQRLVLKLSTLERVAGLTNETIEAEVQKRFDNRMYSTRKLLNTISSQLLGTVKLMGETLETTSGRNSSLGSTGDPEGRSSSIGSIVLPSRSSYSVPVVNDLFDRSLSRKSADKKREEAIPAQLPVQMSNSVANLSLIAEGVDMEDDTAAQQTTNHLFSVTEEVGSGECGQPKRKPCLLPQRVLRRRSDDEEEDEEGKECSEKVSSRVTKSRNVNMVKSSSKDGKESPKTVVSDCTPESESSEENKKKTSKCSKRKKYPEVDQVEETALPSADGVKGQSENKKAKGIPNPSKASTKCDKDSKAQTSKASSAVITVADVHREDEKIELNQESAQTDAKEESFHYGADMMMDDEATIVMEIDMDFTEALNFPLILPNQQSEHQPALSAETSQPKETDPAAKTKQGVAEIADQTKQSVADVSAKTKQGVAEVAGKTKQGVADVAAKTKQGVAEVAGKTKQGVAEVAGKTKQGVSDVAAKTKQGVAEVAGKNKQDVAKIAAKTKHGVAKVAAKTKQGVAEVADKTKQGVVEAAGKTKHGVANIAAKSKLGVAEVATKTKKGVAEAADKTKQGVAEVADKTKQGVAKAAGKTKQCVAEVDGKAKEDDNCLNKESMEICSDQEGKSSDPGKSQVEVRVGKLGQIRYAAGRKDADGVRQAVPLKLPSKTRSKQKKPKAASLVTIGKDTVVPENVSKDPPSIFDYHDKTPQVTKEKAAPPQKSVYDVSINESVVAQKLTLGDFRKQLVKPPSESTSDDDKRNEDKSATDPKEEKTKRTRTKAKKAETSENENKLDNMQKGVTPDSEMLQPKDKTTSEDRTKQGKTAETPDSAVITTSESQDGEPEALAKCDETENTKTEGKTVAKQGKRPRTKARKAEHDGEESKEEIDGNNGKKKEDKHRNEPERHGKKAEMPSEVNGSVDTQKGKKISKLTRTKPRTKAGKPDTHSKDVTTDTQNEEDPSEQQAAAVKPSERSRRPSARIMAQNDTPEMEPEQGNCDLSEAKSAVQTADKNQSETKSNQRVPNLMVNSLPVDDDSPVLRTTQRKKRRMVCESDGEMDSEERTSKSPRIALAEARGSSVNSAVQKSPHLSSKSPRRVEKLSMKDKENLFSQASLVKTVTDISKRTTGELVAIYDSMDSESDSIGKDDLCKRSRRQTSSAICYTEPKLRSKLRQGDKHTSTLYPGQEHTMRCHKQNRGSQSQGKKSILSSK